MWVNFEQMALAESRKASSELKKQFENDQQMVQNS